MSDEFTDLGVDTDQALGMDDTTWSTGIGEYYGAEHVGAEGIELAEDVAGAPALAAPGDGLDAPAPSADVASLPSQLTFGTLSPAGTTEDSYEEKFHWDSARNAYIGMETDREIDEYTGNAKP